MSELNFQEFSDWFSQSVFAEPHGRMMLAITALTLVTALGILRKRYVNRIERRLQSAINAYSSLDHSE